MTTVGIRLGMMHAGPGILGAGIWEKLGPQTSFAEGRNFDAETQGRGFVFHGDFACVCCDRGRTTRNFSSK